MTLDEFINNTKLLGIDVNEEQLDKLSKIGRAHV